jgi:hypothetical protein
MSPFLMDDPNSWKRKKERERERERESESESERERERERESDCRNALPCNDHFVRRTICFGLALVKTIQQKFSQLCLLLGNRLSDCLVYLSL